MMDTQRAQSADDLSETQGRLVPENAKCIGYSARGSESTLQRLPEPSLKQRPERAADMDTVPPA
jgi:hypothetical protein